MTQFVLGQGGPLTVAHQKAITSELVRLTLGARGPERPELVMTSRDWAEVFATRKRKHSQKKRSRR